MPISTNIGNENSQFRIQGSQTELAKFLNDQNLEIDAPNEDSQIDPALQRGALSFIQRVMIGREMLTRMWQQELVELTPPEQLHRREWQNTSNFCLEIILGWGGFAFLERIIPDLVKDYQHPGFASVHNYLPPNQLQLLLTAAIPAFKRGCARGVLPSLALMLIKKGEQYLAAYCASTALKVADWVAKNELRLLIEAENARMHVEAAPS